MLKDKRESIIIIIIFYLFIVASALVMTSNVREIGNINSEDNIVASNTVR